VQVTVAQRRVLTHWMVYKRLTRNLTSCHYSKHVADMALTYCVVGQLPSTTDDNLARNFDPDVDERQFNFGMFVV